jgi:hypothetical protein
MNAKATTILAALFEGAAFAGIIYQDNFQNYADVIPGVSTNVPTRLSNDPIWARGARLEVLPSTNHIAADVFAESIKLPPGNKFDVHFRFWFQNGVAAKAAKPEKDGKTAEPAVEAVPGAFDLVLRAADGREQRVRIASDKVGGQKIAWLDNRLWASFALKANGAKADVYYSYDRALRKIATIDLPLACASLNLGAVPGLHFAITDFVVQTPGPLPSNPVEKHFAAFKSLAQPIAGAKTAAEGEELSLMPSPRSGVRFSLGTTNVSASAALKVFWDGPSKPGAKDFTEVFPLRVTTHRHKMKLPIGPFAKDETIDLPDARIEFGRLFTQAVRPDLAMYAPSRDIEPQGVDIVRDWNRLPPASRHPLDLDFAILPDGAVEVWSDGSLMKTFRRDGASVTNVVLGLPRGAKYAVKQDMRAGVDNDRFTLIDLAANPRAKAFADAKSSIEPGVRDFGGIPIAVAAPLDSADVAICKQGKGSWALECDEYLGRFPSHGFPSAIHFRVPAAEYGRAHILFALDPDPRKEAYLTVRLGHYIEHGVGANMLGDIVVDLRDGKMPESFHKVGTITKGKCDIPVYLASLDLNLGPVLDIAEDVRYDRYSSGEYFDFEFSGKGWENYEQIDLSMKPDPNSDSAFNIFGATLERLPVRIGFRQSQIGNVFTADEGNRKTSFIITALREKAKGRVSWTATDADGREVFHGSEKYSIRDAGSSNVVVIALDKAREPGHYALKVVFEDAASGCKFTHDAAFAVLPPAGRMVGKWDSPYAVWWFAAHGSPGAADIGGPMMQKAGIVRASANRTLKPEDYEKYNLTNYRIANIKPSMDAEGNFLPVKVEFPDPDDPAGKKKITKELPGDEAAEVLLRRALEADPGIDTVMLWHESAPSYGVPEELLGLPVPTEGVEKDIVHAKKVDFCGALVHRLAKELKRDIRLQIGNSGGSVGAVVRPVRAGARIESYDQIGMESGAQVMPPERLINDGLQGMVIAKDVAAYYAKKQGVPAPKLNGCWEFTYRCDRDMGERQQAEWYVRDVLVSLANEFYYISPGLLFDCKNGYFNGLWGGSGIIRRSPFCYPKQAYVAYAVLTKCLDGVKFVRQLDTGSTTVYAVEFKRVDGKTATALWAARGEVEFALEGVRNGTAIHMLGRSEKLRDGVATVSGGTSPTYVVTDGPLSRVTIVGRGFAKDAAIASRAVLAPAVTDVSRVRLEPDPLMETKYHAFLPILKPSAFMVAAVDDDERGACLEIALDTSKNADTSKYVTEYTTVRFAESIPLEGRPVLVGCWIKGNSNWGQIRFEIEDAKGEVFKNLSTGRSWGCDIMDWPGNLAINFDGWNFVYAPLARNTLMNDHSPGPVSEQWVSEGGDKRIDLPVKVRAVTVGMNRHKLDLLDFKPSVPAIRLGAIGGVGE